MESGNTKRGGTLENTEKIRVAASSFGPICQTAALSVPDRAQIPGHHTQIYFIFFQLLALIVKAAPASSAARGASMNDTTKERQRGVLSRSTDRRAVCLVTEKKQSYDTRTRIVVINIDLERGS